MESLIFIAVINLFETILTIDALPNFLTLISSKSFSILTQIHNKLLFWTHDVIIIFERNLY